MKLKKLLLLASASLCAFAISSARAQVPVTLSLTAYVAGATNTVDGTNTVWEKSKTEKVNTEDVLKELNDDLGPFTKEAKLVAITNVFFVQEGETLINVSSVMTLTPGSTVIKAGVTNNTTHLAVPSFTASSLMTLTFSDSSIQFTLTGFGTGTTTDSTPKSGTYTESFKGSVIDMAGEGVSAGAGPFVATGTLSFSGSGKRSL